MILDRGPSVRREKRTDGLGLVTEDAPCRILKFALLKKKWLGRNVRLLPGYYVEVYEDNKWEPLQAGCLPPCLPETRDELLAYIQALRSRLTKAAALKLGGLSYAPDGFPPRFANKAVFILTDQGFAGFEYVYLLPAIAPLWLAAAPFNVEGLPPFPVEPQTAPAAIQALNALAAFLKPALAPDDCRISANADTQEVILDGRVIRIPELPVFKLFAALVKAHKERRTPITRYELFNEIGRKDKDPRAGEFFGQLPKTLEKLIVSSQKPGGGYSLLLPSAKKK